MYNTNFVFKPGKLTTILDASAGSSGKGKIGSFICENANNWQFAVNTFAPQAGHWVRFPNGRKYFYQTFNSCAYQADRYEALYSSPGCIIELPAFFREMEENNIPRHKIKISPLAAILQEKDALFEKGITDIDGKPLSDKQDGTMKTGTTAHGSGACRARRILRRPDMLLARDIPELKEFLCDTPREIMARLDQGQSGLLEVAQGFQLSVLLQEMYPYTTSRNCTVMSGLDDAMIPPTYIGPTIINTRTYPIRISNNKYIAKDGRHLTWEEVKAGTPHEVYQGNSGPGYSDQKEMSWEELTTEAGSPTPIIEMTSVTKLPRRVFTFSKQNLLDAVKFNKTTHPTYISVNFMNYVDHGITGSSGNLNYEDLSLKTMQWLSENIPTELQRMVRFIGTGMNLNDQVVLSSSNFTQSEDMCEDNCEETLFDEMS